MNEGRVQKLWIEITDRVEMIHCSVQNAVLPSSTSFLLVYLVFLDARAYVLAYTLSVDKCVLLAALMLYLSKLVFAFPSIALGYGLRLPASPWAF